MNIPVYLLSCFKTLVIHANDQRPVEAYWQETMTFNGPSPCYNAANKTSRRADPDNALINALPVNILDSPLLPLSLEQFVNMHTNKQKSVFKYPLIITLLVTF